MKKLFFTLCLYCLTYTGVWWFWNAENFLNSSQADTCILASDGCNSYVLKNKSIIRSSTLSCNNKKKIWKCVGESSQIDIQDFVDIKKIESLQAIQKQQQATRNKAIKNIKKQNISQTYNKQKSKLLLKYKKLADRFIKKIHKSIWKKTIKKQSIYLWKVKTKINRKRIYFQNKFKTPTKKQLQIIYLLEYLEQNIF